MNQENAGKHYHIRGRQQYGLALYERLLRDCDPGIGSMPEAVVRVPVADHRQSPSLRETQALPDYTNVLEGLAQEPVPAAEVEVQL